jgi:hypothetical protein
MGHEPLTALRLCRATPKEIDSKTNAPASTPYAQQRGLLAHRAEVVAQRSQMDHAPPSVNSMIDTTKAQK